MHKVLKMRVWADIAPGLFSALFLILAVVDGAIGNPIAAPFAAVLAFPFAFFVAVLNLVVHQGLTKHWLFVDSDLPDVGGIQTAPELETALKGAADGTQAIKVVMSIKAADVGTCFSDTNFKLFFEKVAAMTETLDPNQVNGFTTVLTAANLRIKDLLKDETKNSEKLVMFRDLNKTFEKYHCPTDKKANDNIFDFTPATGAKNTNLEKVKVMSQLKAGDIVPKDAFPLVVDGWQAIQTLTAGEKTTATADLTALVNVIKEHCKPSNYDVTDATKATASLPKLEAIMTALKAITDDKFPTEADVGGSGTDPVFKNIVTELHPTLKAAYAFPVEIAMTKHAELGIVKNSATIPPALTEFKTDTELKAIMKDIPEGFKLADFTDSSSCTCLAGIRRHIVALKTRFAEIKTNVTNGATHADKAFGEGIFDKLSDIDLSKIDSALTYTTELMEMIAVVNPTKGHAYLCDAEVKKLEEASKKTDSAVLVSAIIAGFKAHKKFEEVTTTAAKTETAKVKAAIRKVYAVLATQVSTALALQPAVSDGKAALEKKKGDLNALVTSLITNQISFPTNAFVKDGGDSNQMLSAEKDTLTTKVTDFETAELVASLEEEKVKIKTTVDKASPTIEELVAGITVGKKALATVPTDKPDPAVVTVKDLIVTDVANLSTKLIAKFESLKKAPNADLNAIRKALSDTFSIKEFKDGELNGTTAGVKIYFAHYEEVKKHEIVGTAQLIVDNAKALVKEKKDIDAMKPGVIVDNVREMAQAIIPHMSQYEFYKTNLHSVANGIPDGDDNSNKETIGKLWTTYTALVDAFNKKAKAAFKTQGHANEKKEACVAFRDEVGTYGTNDKPVVTFKPFDGGDGDIFKSRFDAVKKAAEV